MQARSIRGVNKSKGQSEEQTLAQSEKRLYIYRSLRGKYIVGKLDILHRWWWNLLPSLRGRRTSSDQAEDAIKWVPLSRQPTQMTCSSKTKQKFRMWGPILKKSACQKKQIQSKSYVQCLTPAGKHAIEERFPGHCWAGVTLKPVTVTSTNVLFGQGITFTVEVKGLCRTHFNITEEGERRDPARQASVWAWVCKAV